MDPTFSVVEGALADRLCVVTGAGRGQGRAVALRFASEGAEVVVAEVDSATGEETAAIITAAGGQATFFQIDVADEYGWMELEQSVLSRPVDVLYNNAALLHPADGSIIDLDHHVWERVLDVNLKGVALGCRTVLPYMVAAHRGSIINVASLRAGLGASVAQDAYTASKGAVVALTRSIAVQFGPNGIRANAIALGTVDTPMIESMPPDARAQRLDRYPLGRFGTVDDVAGLALFLASDDSSWLTGATVTLDGGASAFYM